MLHAYPVHGIMNTWHRQLWQRELVTHQHGFSTTHQFYSSLEIKKRFFFLKYGFIHDCNLYLQKKEILRFILKVSFFSKMSTTGSPNLLYG